jgi:hypothetical protein
MDADKLTAQVAKPSASNIAVTLEGAYNRGLDAFTGYVAGLDKDDRAHLEDLVNEYAI